MFTATLNYQIKTYQCTFQNYLLNLKFMLLSMDEPVAIVDSEEQTFPSKWVTCTRRWLNYQIKIYLVRLDEYTIELKLMTTLINGERRCIRIILPSSANLVRLFHIINDMIPVIVNQNIHSDLSFRNDCRSVHILVGQPMMMMKESSGKNVLFPEKTDISDGSFSIASRFPDIDHIPTYVLADTALRRIKNVISTRYLLFLLVQRIENIMETLPDDTSEIIISSPRIPMQVEAFQTKYFGCECGYQLRDGSLGMIFCDRTSMVLLPNFKELYYINKWGDVRYFRNEKFSPPFLQLKLEKLSKLKTIAIPAEENFNDGRQLYDIAYLSRFIKWKSSTVLFFSDGRLEIILDTGKKLIFSPFAKPICVTVKKKLAQVMKVDCKFALEACTTLIRRYWKHQGFFF